MGTSPPQLSFLCGVRSDLLLEFHSPETICAIVARSVGEYVEYSGRYVGTSAHKYVWILWPPVSDTSSNCVFCTSWHRAEYE